MQKYDSNSKLLIGTRKKSILLLFLCFSLPVVVLLCIFLTYNIAPFGDKSVLIMDMSGQYCEFYCGLKNISYNNGGILFSWSKAFGGNYAGVFAYYLASPLSLLTLLCPNEYMPIGLTFLTVLKIGLCGLSFGILMNYFGKNKISIVIFSLFYALMSYNIVYSMCLMWIDAVIWLPIIILAIEKIAEGKKTHLLCISLTFLFISTYYMAYMVGIFACIYVIYVIVRQKWDSWKDIGAFLGRFVGSAIIAAGLGAWLLLPTAASLFEGKIGSTFVSPENGLNYEISAILSKFFLGTYDSITNTGTPFFYIGAIVSIMFIAYFFIGSISIKEKIVTSFITLFVVVSTLVFDIDLMWHVFQKPNWFPYRYFFVFGFIVIYTACKASFKFKEIPIGYFIGALICGPLIYKIIYEFNNNSNIEENYILTLRYFIIEAVLLLLISVFVKNYDLLDKKIFRLLELQKNKNYAKSFQKVYRKILFMIMAIFILFFSFLEIHHHAIGLIEGLDDAHRYESFDKYRDYKMLTQDLADKADKLAENEFYRMGSCFQRNFNEPIGLGYAGISHYSSSYNSDVNEFLANMGFAQVYFWSSYAGSTMVTDSLFSIKYVMGDDEILKLDDNGKIISWCNALFDSYNIVYQNETSKLYENPYALPLCFSSSADLKNFDYKGNPIENQNYIFNCIMGDKSVQYFNELNKKEAVINNFSNEDMENLIFPGEYKNDIYYGGVRYYLSASEDGPLYAYFPYNGSNRASMSINDGKEIFLYTSETNCIQYLGTYKKGDIVKLEIKGDVFTNGNRFYSLNEDLFASNVETLRQASLNITKWSSGYLEGTIDVNENRSVFTSLVYDDAWSVMVDGEEVDKWSVKDALMAFDIPEGEHKIVIKYNVPGFKAGVLISSITIAGILFWYTYRKLKNAREK